MENTAGDPLDRKPVGHRAVTHQFTSLNISWLCLCVYFHAGSFSVAPLGRQANAKNGFHRIKKKTKTLYIRNKSKSSRKFQKRKSWTACWACLTDCLPFCGVLACSVEVTIRWTNVTMSESLAWKQNLKNRFKQMFLKHIKNTPKVFCMFLWALFWHIIVPFVWWCLRFDVLWSDWVVGLFCVYIHRIPCPIILKPQRISI